MNRKVKEIKLSYNISKWKTKKLEGLVIPLKAFYKHPREDWHPSSVITNPETNEMTLDCGCEQSIKGTINGALLTVTTIDMSGEGSGAFYDWILQPALKESSGILEAVLIWERGDSINKLSVVDGTVTTEEIEL